MNRFARMIEELDSSTGTNDKINALQSYFNDASDKDVLWTIALLSGKRPKRSIKTSLMREASRRESNIPEWIFEESYHVVGDLAETIALLQDDPKKPSNSDLDSVIRELRDQKEKGDEEKVNYLIERWNSLTRPEIFVFNKLLTGGFRIGVSQKLMVRALSRFIGKDENELAHRLMGDWDPFESDLQELLFSENNLAKASKPYPFYLAYALEGNVEDLGSEKDWFAEPKWDGIRGQIIVRQSEHFVWSRGEELMTDRFPEFNVIPELLPNGCVLDGEIICYSEEGILPFSLLQTRIGRKRLGPKILSDAPVAFIAYDLLEFEGKDLRNQPLKERRKLLEKLIPKSNPPLLLSDQLNFKSWDELLEFRKNSRAHKCEGLMLKKKDSIYESGRKRGGWWKWKVDPLTIDAVLLYAMRGHGRRSNLYTDYSFAVWKGDELVTFAKAYSGLTDAELKEVDRFVKANTIERFGPVRSVKAELVMELAFEGISASKRHKSGVALRFPRIKRWRQDKKASEANTLEDLEELLKQYGN